MRCEGCGTENRDTAVFCRACGSRLGASPVAAAPRAAPTGAVGEPAAWPAAGESNTSGLGPTYPVPQAVRHWNWGAFALTLFWTAAHSLWGWFAALLLLVFAPGLLFGIFAIFLEPFLVLAWLIMVIYLGARGSELGWRARRFDSVEHFLCVQRAWGITVLILFIVSAVIVGAATVGVLVLWRSSIAPVREMMAARLPKEANRAGTQPSPGITPWPGAPPAAPPPPSVPPGAQAVPATPSQPGAPGLAAPASPSIERAPLWRPPSPRAPGLPTAGRAGAPLAPGTARDRYATRVPSPSTAGRGSRLPAPLKPSRVQPPTPPATKVPPETPMDSALAFMNRYTSAYGAGDVGAMSALFASDALVNGRPYAGVIEVIRGRRSQCAFSRSGITFFPGGEAFVSGRFTAQPPGVSYLLRITLQRQPSGEWLIRTLDTR
jgi:hypothetical protein